jgi:translation elongation factor EF-Tu-like GTPase
VVDITSRGEIMTVRLAYADAEKGDAAATSSLRFPIREGGKTVGAGVVTKILD